jgi:hypothetical protein
VIPNCCLGANFDLAPSSTIPVIELKFSPIPPAIIQHRFKRWTAPAFQMGAAHMFRLSFRRYVIERIIQPQPRDETCTFKKANLLE